MLSDVVENRHDAHTHGGLIGVIRDDLAEVLFAQTVKNLLGLAQRGIITTKIAALTTMNPAKNIEVPLPSPVTNMNTIAITHSNNAAHAAM